MPLEMPLDGNAEILVSDDLLSASLYFKRADADYFVAFEQLEKWLYDNGIVYGIKRDLLRVLAASPMSYSHPVIIAEGKRSVEGKSGRVEYIYNMDEHNKMLVETEDGKVNYKEINQLRNVKRGQLIARKIPPGPSEPGVKVNGEPIPAADGKEARFKIGKNVVIGPDEVSLYAAIDGILTKTERDKINVFPVYEVNGDVDYRTGNIDFVGTVVIRGNVLTGFRVRASGDIRIVGGIEGADVETEGSIEITGGILAGGKGVVKAGKTVKSSFIQEGNIVAGEDVIVAQSIMHSNVRAGRNVQCVGAKGLIVGGTIQAGEKISARLIGNSTSTATELAVGVKPELRQKLAELRNEVRALVVNLDKTDKALALLDQLAAAGQLSSERLEMRAKLNATRKRSLETEKQLKEELLEIEKSLEDTQVACVEVKNTIYGGTKIVIGRYTRFIKERSERVRFHYSEGDITVSPFQ
ncbi:DUF342 domain-containing protein [Paenibacillus sp. GCM10012307]|uniref:DUF342 domain-containing protein n=1 Tax=Paenibacillus roseus TaxID=2798579 RepID=A0A934J508_9BACL|nr:FapA family protein [Paenibacillus roseus]MBJ6363404.1 DUF342 domain-containing protein [Paenibacillus roseus]